MSPSSRSPDAGQPEPGPWSVRVRLNELQRGPVAMSLSPDADARVRIAASLDLIELPSLEAEVKLAPWMDGAELTGRWRARVVQTCGVTLEPFETGLSGELRMRYVPADSRLAVRPEGEMVLELDAEDPPDVLEHDWIDLAAAILEHVALDLDPFPRKPGVEFEPPPVEAPPSPFAVLAKLKPDPGGGAGE